MLSTVLRLSPVPIYPVAFRFEWSDEAARHHNFEILKEVDLDLAAALAAQPFSTLTPGSEFRPAHLLAPFLSRHPLWPRFRERITLGAQFPSVISTNPPASPIFTPSLPVAIINRPAATRLRWQPC